MSASRKRNVSNQRIAEAHERKELKEENQRLIDIYFKCKRTSKRKHDNDYYDASLHFATTQGELNGI